MGNLQFKRGLKANLPSSETIGTPLWCTDTKELYIGTGTGVQKVGSSDSSGTSSSGTTSTSTTTVSYNSTSKTLILGDSEYTSDVYSKSEIDSMLGNIETLLQGI